MADVTVQLTIPEAAVPKVVDAFTKLSGARMSLDADKMVNDTMFNGRWDFTVSEQGAETTKQFAIRFILELIKATVKLVDYAEDRDRYSAEVSAIPQPSQDVPDNIITGAQK